MIADRFELSSHLKKTTPVAKISFIEKFCRGKDVLDLGCIRHNADFAFKDPGWLHKRIKNAARKTVGVDYMKKEVEKLNKAGYDILYGDVTRPLKIKGSFDVIVAGDLIEHLNNFEGFFDNCKKLLKKNGVLLISTPNPFFTDEFHYLSFKNNYLVNPEHTCWIDPLCLLQLSGRFGFALEDARFIRPSWKLSGMICEDRKHPYDILNDKWQNETFDFKVKRMVARFIFSPLYSLYKFLSGTDHPLVRYSDYIAVLKPASGKSKRS